MFSLQHINIIPNIDEVYLCERDGRLCCVRYGENYVEEIKDSSRLNIPQSIDIRRELFHLTSKSDHRDDNRSLMIPVSETIIKRITRTIFESGFLEALKIAADDTDIHRNNRLIYSVAKFCLSIVEIGNNVKYYFKPYLKDEGIITIAKLSQTRDWMHSIIRHIKFHPNYCKMAVATSDDSIRVYTNNKGIVQTLKNYRQKNITSMSWRPFAAGELAIGCQNGIIIWSLDPNSNITRPLSQPIQLKQIKNHCPVICVEWNSNGTLLASSSINDSNILIWDVDQNRCTPLKRIGPPCSLLLWSLDDSRLFSSTIGNIFRVWSTDEWLPERWMIPHGTIQSAAWSPCCNYLMFITTNEPILYCLRFIEEPLYTNTSNQKQALPVADLSKVKIGHTEVGGQPQSIAWDPNGEHIAVTFKHTANVALFRTTINRHLLNISPSCFLVGINGEHPSYICFQNKYKDSLNTILLIGWSSGRIQYFPFV